jgi:Tfp pilus assembly protein PilN
MWVSGLLLLACAGLLIWGLTLDSDLKGTQEDVAALQTKLDENEQQGATVSAALQAGYTALMQEIGATQADVDATAASIDQAKQTVAQAEQDAQAAAERATDKASSAVEQAQARVDEAQARGETAGAKATIAADCGRAYLSALGSLFDGDSVRTQVAAVRKQLQGISADCKAAMAGTSAP